MFVCVIHTALTEDFHIQICEVKQKQRTMKVSFLKMYRLP